MIEEHIAHGDLVAVQRNPEVEDGRIVVVRIDGAHTLKKIRLQGKRVVLYPRNRKYSAREVQPYEDAEVIGGFIGVIRTLKQPKK
jgi:SOS-response transcriptional repressor LexA